MQYTKQKQKLQAGAVFKSFRQGVLSNIDTTGINILFTNIDIKQNTHLSVYVWKYFYMYGKRPKMVWSIIHKIKKTTNCAQRISQTCNMERTAIAAEDREQPLNKRHDLTNVCPHNRKLYFKQHSNQPFLFTFTIQFHKHT